jgi:hypothetical protein
MPVYNAPGKDIALKESERRSLLSESKARHRLFVADATIKLGHRSPTQVSRRRG